MAVAGEFVVIALKAVKRTCEFGNELLDILTVGDAGCLAVESWVVLEGLEVAFYCAFGVLGGFAGCYVEETCLVVVGCVERIRLPFSNCVLSRMLI